MISSIRPAVILFDVNETLLNMEPLKKAVNSIMGSKRGFRIWFGMLLQYSLVDNSIGIYHNFSVIADATLDMAAKALDKKINQKDKELTLVIIKKLLPYKDVKEGLKNLKEAGFRLATLTNSPLPVLKAQMDHGELTNYFEALLSIDAVHKYKPAPETYQYAADTLGVKPSDIILVAAHGWDIGGAMKAGLSAAFVEREGQSLYPLTPAPQFTGKDIIEVAKNILLKFGV